MEYKKLGKRDVVLCGIKKLAGLYTVLYGYCFKIFDLLRSVYLYTASTKTWPLTLNYLSPFPSLNFRLEQRQLGNRLSPAFYKHHGKNFTATNEKKNFFSTTVIELNY